MSDTASSDFVRPLPGKLRRALDGNLSPGEPVEVSLRPDTGQAIVVTDRRVLIIKAGKLFTGAGWFAARTKSLPFSEISSVDLRVGLVGGHLKISVAGTSQPPDVGIRAYDMMKAENVITFGSAYKEIMKAVAAIIRGKLDVAHGVAARELASATIEAVKARAEADVEKKRRGQWQGVLGGLGLLLVVFAGLAVLGSRPPNGSSRPPQLSTTRSVRPGGSPAVAYYPYLKKTPDEQSQGLWPGDTAILGSCQPPIPAFPPSGRIGPVKQKTAMPQGECAEPAAGEVVAGSSENALEWVAQTGSYKYQGQMVADRVQGGVMVLVLSGSGGPSSKVRVMESLDAAKAVSEATRMKWDLEPMEIDFRGGKDYLIQGVVQDADLHLIWRTPDRCDKSAGVWPAWCGQK